MLALSTYLGHSCIENTYWYLKATPMLLRRISEMANAPRPGGCNNDLPGFPCNGLCYPTSAS